jgi:hypothetical protein
MIETATENKGTILAYDEDGNTVIPGDMVVYRRKLYKVEHMEHEISNDGYYTETVVLLLEHYKTGKQIVVEDFKVEVLG